MKARITLAEVAYVTAAAFVVAAIIRPFVLENQFQGRINASLLKLRRLHDALILYTEDAGGISYTDPSKSLPPSAYVYTTFLGLDRSDFVSDCGYNPLINPNFEKLTVSYTFDGSDVAVNYFQKRREKAFLFTDGSCNRDARLWTSVVAKKRGLGVTVDGNAVIRYKAGNADSLDWW